MHFYERIKQKFVYIYLFLLARRFYRFLKNFPNVGYDTLERGYRYIAFHSISKCYNNWIDNNSQLVNKAIHFKMKFRNKVTCKIIDSWQ